MLSSIVNGGLTYLHDSSGCIRCIATKTFYSKLRAARLHSTRSSSRIQFIGLITYLERVVQVNVTVEDTSPIVIPPHLQAKNSRILQDSNSQQQDASQVKDPPSRRASTLSSCSLKKHNKKGDIHKNVSIVKKNKDGISKKKVKAEVPLSHVPKKPKLGTLKRKRDAIKNLLSDVNYEDDIFEGERTPCELVLLSDDDSDSIDVQNMETPRFFCMTPQEESNTPSYEDCYSPTELQMSRKEAEEYQYRRNKRMRGMRNAGDSESERSPCTDDTTLLLQAACRVLEERMKTDDDDGSGDEEEKDYYFSDDD